MILKHFPHKMKSFKKNLLISIKRSLRDNEVVLGVSLGLLIACIGLLIMHMQDSKTLIHAAPQEIEQGIKQEFFMEDKFYKAPKRAISV